jgi:hypothetical protein
VSKGERLLVGIAAGLAGAAAAQAAELPVKAKPIEYVKVCSLYGAGFWYVPGTDTCLKVGAYVRAQSEWNAGNGGIPIGFGVNAGDVGAGRFDRTDSSQLSFRTRAGISLDTRTQTEYGTLRGYLEGGFQTSALNGTAPTNDTIWMDRAFIQFGGLTAGRIRSYFDINSFGAYNYANQRMSGDTTALGLWGIAYTVQGDGGLSATLSFEDGGSSSQGNSAGQNTARQHMVVNLSMTSQFGLGTTSYDNAGWRFPDVIGAVRVDRAWGYAQVSAALHDASGGYYQTGGSALASGIQNNGHPADARGWAVSGGFTLNDFLGWKSDVFGMQTSYSQGAAGYVTRATGPFEVYGSGNSAAFAWITDGVFTTGSAVELTTVWGVNGFVQHFWSPRWRTSLYGGYVEVDYGAAARAMICPGGAASAALQMTAVSNCSPSFSFWQAGTRTQWNPHPDLDIGVDVLFSHLNTAFAGTATLVANGARPGGIYAIQDQDVWTVFFRIQRNFLP